MKIKEQLNITTIQSDIFWEDIDANLSLFDTKIAAINQTTDIIVLPEMFNTGFTMNVSELAETMDGKTVLWLQQKAKETQTVLICSIIIVESKHYYNRMLVVGTAGVITYYDKHHLFSMAKEQTTFTAGEKQVYWKYKGWLIALFVCYDLRFPAWNRNLVDYDVAIYIASWPSKRSYHWRSLLSARAIENQAYVVAVNRVGQDGNGFAYSGDTTVLDAAGELLYHLETVEATTTHILSSKTLAETRKKYPFLNDRDNFKINL